MSVRRALWVVAGLIACGEPPRHAVAEPAGAAGGAAPPPGVAGASAPAAARAADVPEIVAEVAGKPITWDELFEVASGDIIAAESAVYEARNQALEGMIVQKLVEAEAAKQKLSVDALIAAQVQAGSTPVTDEEIAKFYAENRSQMQGSIEEMKPRISQYLEQERAGAIIRAYVDKLKVEANVKTFLPYYRLDVAAKDSPRKGSAEAPIQIVEFSDFQCPYCSQAAATVRAIEEKYGDRVSVVYRHFPLPMHGSAHRAAEASQCANDQGQFWKYHDTLFGDQKPWTDEDYKRYAKDLGLDAKAFDACLTGGQHVATVDEDMADGHRVGMSGTPGFYVNGIVMSGARPIEDFVTVIDSELAGK